MPGRSGRPLDPSFTPALRQAAAEILAEGSKLTVHALSERTGVGKPAIYRRFPNTAALALSVVADRLTGGQGPDTGSLRGDLTATLRRLRDSLADPAISAGLALVVAERRLPGVDFGRTLIDPWSDSIALMIRRAVERDEIPPGVDTEAVFLLLLGPLLLHVMLPERPALDDDYLEWFAQAVLSGLGHLPELAHPRCASQRILDAAGAEYAAHGFYATTLDQISERAEVGPREIRARFGDTKQLARVLLDYERTAWAAWEKTIRGRSLTGVAAVRELLLLAANHYATDQRLQGAARLAVESHHIDPRRPHPYKRQLQVLRRAVGRDLSGLPDGTTADGFTATVLATFAGLTTAVNGQWADLPERIGQFWDLLKTTI